MSAHHVHGRTVALAACIAGALPIAGCAHAAPLSAPTPWLTRRVAFSLPTSAGSLATVPVPGAGATALDFFAPSCEPCRRRLPALWVKHDALAARGVALLLVAVLSAGQPADEAARALASWGAGAAPFLVDRGDASAQSAGVSALPATIVLDGQGVLRWSAPFDASADDVAAAARSVVEARR